MDSFSLQDKVMRVIISSKECMNLLGVKNVKDVKELNSKIYREECPVKLITTDNVPFITIVVINSFPSSNYLFNHAILELGIYTHTRYQASKIFKAIIKLLQQNFEDFAIIHQGQVGSGVNGIYKYSVRFTPIING